ncbi:MAG: hypothetical protein JSS22_18195 [Proteobacteria bacterium]|nr:hypothetical protein [Pseudomonadota bacterium]
MNWSWASSLDQLWRSPTFPMWLTLAAAGFFGIVVLLTLLRAEKSVANGALTVITLLSIGVAVAATIRGFGPGSGVASGAANLPMPVNVAMPALSCIDDLAGDAVEEACEKALFGTPDATAAAVSYAASEVTRLRSFGDAAAANKVMSPELQALRRAVERDRYGLVAHVLMARDRCTPTECAAFRFLTDHNQVAANMQERIYEGMVSRYVASWNAPAANAANAVPGLSAIPGLAASVPTGKPTNAEFPTSASIPPVNIMTPEPPVNAPSQNPASPATAQAVPVPRPAPATPHAAPKKPAAPKAHAAAPVRLTPAPASASKPE